MSNKFRPKVSLPQLFPRIKPWLGTLLLIVISSSFSEFTSIVHVRGMNIAVALGIVLGVILEIKFELEMLFVGGLIGLMLLSFALMVLLIPLSNSQFELSFILTSITILTIVGYVLSQWLIRNWIVRFWGKLHGITASAIAISLGSGLAYFKIAN